jgi:hypothetical protein
MNYFETFKIYNSTFKIKITENTLAKKQFKAYIKR